MLKVGIIGVGRIGALLEEDKLRQHPCTHLAAYKATKKCEVVAIADIDFDKAQKVADKWGVPAKYKDYQTMCQVHKPDIISVCTPTETHAEILYEIVKFKPKLVFMEKPLAHNLDAAKEMVDVCQDHNVKLAVNHTRRWHPAYQRAKRFIDKGEIGDVRRIVGYCSGEPLNDGIHMFDLFNFYAGGEADKICSFVSLKLPYLFFEIDIFGDDGRIVVPSNGRSLRVYKPAQSRYYTGYRELILADGGGYGKTRLTPMLRAVRNLIFSVEKDQQPLCTGVDGFKALELALKWRKDHEQTKSFP